MKKSTKGSLYFNLLEAPRENKKEEANQETSDVQEPDSKKESTIGKVPSKKIDECDFIGNLARELQLKLQKDHVQVRLNDNRWFIINKFFTGKDKYDAYLEGLKGLLL